MEAQSYGIPAIATDVGGTHEIVYDGVNGLLLKKDFSDEELLKAISIVFSNIESFQMESIEVWGQLAMRPRTIETFLRRSLEYREERKMLKRKLSRFLYETIAKYLPKSSARIKVGKKLRGWCVKGMLPEVGEDVNVERMADIASNKLKIGNHSGIGVRAYLQGDITIGDYVMMAPDVSISQQIIIRNESIFPCVSRETQQRSQ